MSRSDNSDVKPNQAGQAWMDALPDPTVAIDAEGRLEWANRAAVTLFGRTLADFRGRSALELVHPEDLHFAAMSLGTVRGKEVGTLIEIRVDTPLGWRLVEVVGANRLGQAGVDCIILTLRDLTERRRWEVGRGDDAVFRAVVHNAASLLMLVGEDGRIRAISGAVTRLLGRDPEALEGMEVLGLVATEDRESVHGAMVTCRGALPHDREPVTVEAGLVDADGEAVPFELTLVDMGSDPTIAGIVVSGHNIAKLRAFQSALADLARRDPLTMLPNRSAADERLERLLEDRVTVAVAFVDLDGFKALNDEFGHHYGDLVLRAVGVRLCSTVRPTDLVARYGGDEFVIIAHDLAEGARLDQRLSAALSEPLLVGGRQVRVQATVGVTYTRSDDTVTTALVRADRAMYAEKRNRGRIGAAAG